MKKKVLPTPTLETTLISPPCSSIIPLAMTRPKPVPFCFFVTAFFVSNCLNLLKMLFIFSFSIPIPVSDTNIIINGFFERD